MSTAKRVLRNTFFLSGSNLLSRFIGAFVIIYVARKLGDVAFGKLNYAEAILQYLLLISDFGLTTLAIREIAKDKKLTQKYSSNIISLRLLISILIIVVIGVLFLIPSIDQQIKYLLFFYALTLIPQAIDLRWVFQAFERMQFIAYVQITQSIINSGLILLFIFKYPDVILIPIANLIALVVSSIITIIIAQKKGFNFKFKNLFHLDKSFIKQSAILALPLGFSFVLSKVYYNFDTVLLKIFQSDAVVGWYNASYKIIFLFTLAGKFFSNSLFPTLSQRTGELTSSLHNIITRSLKYLSIFSLPLAVGGTLIGPNLILFLYGSEYTNSSSSFQILIWSIVFMYFNLILSSSLISQNLQKKQVISVSVGAISNVILNIIVIPIWSLTGAAITTLISLFLVFIINYHYLRKVIPKLNIAKIILKPLLCAVLMGIALYFFKDFSIFITIPLSAVLYFFLLLLSKTLGKQDLTTLRELVKKT